MVTALIVDQKYLLYLHNIPFYTEKFNPLYIIQNWGFFFRFLVSGDIFSPLLAYFVNFLKWDNSINRYLNHQIRQFIVIII